MMARLKDFSVLHVQARIERLEKEYANWNITREVWCICRLTFWNIGARR
jgi:hypothetical protein